MRQVRYYFFVLLFCNAKLCKQSNTLKHVLIKKRFLV